MKIDWIKVQKKLDEMLWYAEDVTWGNGQRIDAWAEVLSPMFFVLRAETVHSDRLYLSDKDWGQAVRDACSDNFTSSDEVQVDLDAMVSEGDDDGAYVQAWVWVDGSGARAAAQRLINARSK